ncbi:hypothetical protein [Asanoa iriomotensis]|uniref:Uncharacterized protein n=1 Tax=Asanoa iriomotensis TaxID=234613 RepID=A0ABQ4BZ26_9ACTN|nr:hypothetical protein [Asanoa iriomotensis]GIF55787.1 hypothetical protein Air01nite_18820 [Asanoa iriomotensis]
MRDFLRFFLSATDQARVDPASVTITEAALTNAQQALTITFKITNPAAGPPQIRPLFPGSVVYVADPAAPGSLPEPAATDVTPAGYATWRTRGSLRVKVNNTTVETAIRDHGATLEVQPNIAWYAPVQLTQTFMLTTLVSGLKKGDIKGATAVVKPAHADWPKHAVSGFLKGVYSPELRLGATAAADDVAAHAMPAVVMATDGTVTLTITIARTQPPQDGPAAAMDLLSPGVSREDPRHAINGGIPAHHVLRVLGPHLIDAAATDPLADAVLKPGRAYFPFTLTRTWQNVPNFSVQFPPRSAIVGTGSGGSIVLPIPAHGVVYVPRDPVVPPQPPPVLTLNSILAPAGSPTTFLAGSTADAWNVKSGTTAIPLSATAPTHVILRRPLREEILADTAFPSPGGMRCTYMSLRRATRAFVDHRVTGGRLVNEGATTSKITRDLMTAAWNAASARILENGRPAPSASPGLARELEKIWRLFFPADVPAHDIDGTGNTARTVIYDGGQMFYALWQTIESVLAAEGSKRNFSDDHVGTGAPGAVAAIGLSPAFLTRPPHAGASPTPAELTANLNAMLTLLTPGAVLQFWHLRDDYRLERDRNGPPASYGHSPIFRRYLPSVNGVPTGIVVIDQFGGDSECPVDADRITWHGAGQDVWIAAQWND